MISRKIPIEILPFFLVVFIVLNGSLIKKATAEERPAFPSYDIASYCTKVSALLGDNPLFKEGCASNESDAQTRLHRVWNDPPINVETECLKMMGVGSPNNYQALSGCVAIAVGNYWMRGDIKISR